MWQREDGMELGADVKSVTTSVWRYPEVALIGVMRYSMLTPPCLWVQVLKGGLRNTRRAPEILTELQQLIHAPTVYAEAECRLPRNQKFLTYLGFKEVSSLPDRTLYIRSI